MTTIGLFGTGRIGVPLARMFAQAGQKVILGSRNINRAKEIVKGLGQETLSAGSYEDAANTDVILPGMFLRDGMLDILEPGHYYNWVRLF